MYVTYFSIHENTFEKGGYFFRPHVLKGNIRINFNIYLLYLHIA